MAGGPRGYRNGGSQASSGNMCPSDTEAVTEREPGREQLGHEEGKSPISGTGTGDWPGVGSMLTTPIYTCTGQWYMHENTHVHNAGSKLGWGQASPAPGIIDTPWLGEWRTDGQHVKHTPTLTH